MISPRWEWAFVDESGHPAPVELSPAFTSRFDAEEWLGGTWRTIAARGGAAALLRHDGDQIDQVNLVGSPERQEG